MVVLVPKRKSRTSKKTEDPSIFFSNNLCSIFSRSIRYTLHAILFFVILYLWLCFTNVISDNIFHVCIFSQKFNDPYYLTAGSKPGIQIGSKETETFVGVIPGDRVSDTKGFGVLDQDRKPKNLDQEDKFKNLDSVLDQEHKPKNKVDLNSLIDLKAEEEYKKYIKPQSTKKGYALKAVIKYLYLQRSWLYPFSGKQQPQ